jgi:hypothetical protein
MNLSAQDEALWAAGLVGNAVLFAALILRQRWRGFPVFTVLIGFYVARTVLLFAMYRYSSALWYARVYWFAASMDFGLQLGVVWEVARIVMRPTGTWVQDARKQFYLWGGAGVLLAAALPWLVSPPASNLLGVMEVRGNLFTSVLICELFFVVTLTSTRLGLGWRNHVAALIVGWAVWVIVAMFVDGLHSFFGAQRYFTVLEHVRMYVYLGALGYWIVQFWLQEPARRPISPELREHILALHTRVQSNLDTLDGRR